MKYLFFLATFATLVGTANMAMQHRQTQALFPEVSTEVIKMKNVANSRFTIKSWDEKPYSEGQDLPKLTRAVVSKTYTGDIAGEGHVEYLMMYRSDGSAACVGLERVVGHIAGKAGSFVLQHTGVFESGVAKGSYFVIPGSGTGELQGLRGEGTAVFGHGTEWPLTLNYELD